MSYSEAPPFMNNDQNTNQYGWPNASPDNNGWGGQQNFAPNQGTWRGMNGDEITPDGAAGLMGPGPVGQDDRKRDRHGSIIEKRYDGDRDTTSSRKY